MKLFLGFEGCLQLHETKSLQGSAEMQSFPKSRENDLFSKLLIFIKAEKMTTIYRDVH